MGDRVGESGVLRQAERVGLRSHRSARAQFLAARRFGRLYNLLGSAVVVLTTTAGTAIFASMSAGDALGWRIATGLVTLLAAVLAALQTFLKLEERADGHRRSARQFAQLKRHAELLVLDARTGR